MKRKPLVKDQPGFAEHKVPDLNLDIDFNKLTIGSSKSIRYLDDEGNVRRRRVCNMDWGSNPFRPYKLERLGLVRDVPGFQEHRLQELNPDIDFSKLTIGSAKYIRYIDDKGNEQYKQTASMDWDGNPFAPYKLDRLGLVRDVPGFEEHRLQELNPDIDFSKLTTGSSRYIRYIDDSGNEQCRQPYNMDWAGSPYSQKKRHYGLVKDVPGFEEHRLQELNPDIDFSKLTTGSGRYIRYIDDSGKEQCREVRHMNWGGNPFAYELERLGLVRDVPGFEEHRLQELNPDIDFSKLTTGSDTSIRFIDDRGNERCRRVAGMDWGGSPFACKKTPISLSESEMVGEDLYFWAHCAETDDAVKENLKRTGKANKREYCNFVCDHGHHFRTNIKRFYDLPLEEACHYCSGSKVIPGLTDAASVDPDLALFYSPSNPKPLRTISPYNNKSYIWKCPHCGYSFPKVISNMTGKSPKCPRCKDTGHVHMRSKFGDDFLPYLSLIRDQGGRDD